MIDRRFLDIRFTVKGFVSALPNTGYIEYGDQYILSADATSSDYPDAKKDCIAIYTDVNGSSKWTFVKPSHVTSGEVINLATGEILRYGQETNGHPEGWNVVGYMGAAVLPYVVDRAVSSHSEVQGNVGLTYIVYNEDNKVYRVTGTGSTGYEALWTASVGDKVGVISEGKLYTVVDSEGTQKFSNSYTYIPENSLVLSSRTQILYLSSYSTGYDLVPTSQQRSGAGETGGILCTEKHTFTAAEVAAQEITLTNRALSNSIDSLVCFLNGGVHVPETDFSASYDSSSKLITISWEDYSYSWYDSAPRAGEVAVFQYYKE